MGRYVALPRPEGADPFVPGPDEVTVDAACFLGNDEEDGQPRFQAHQFNPWAQKAVEDERIVPDGAGVNVKRGEEWLPAARGDFIIYEADGGLNVLSDTEMVEQYEVV